jgi:hypothetical protein
MTPSPKWTAKQEIDRFLPAFMCGRVLVTVSLQTLLYLQAVNNYWFPSVIPHGTGKHVWVGPPEATKVWATGLFISEIVYTLTLVTVKWSTLAFYWRIFGSKPTIHIPIWILFGIIAAWGVAVVSITNFNNSINTPVR